MNTTGARSKAFPQTAPTDVIVTIQWVRGGMGQTNPRFFNRSLSTDVACPLPTTCLNIIGSSCHVGFQLFRISSFRIKSAVLNAELLQNSCLHILEEKEQADGESHVEGKRSSKHAMKKLDSEFRVMRGIDFKDVHMGMLQGA
ncbi:hypothetical protein CsSME_00003549 [Camellia sinensis var. sinensis]